MTSTTKTHGDAAPRIRRGARALVLLGAIALLPAVGTTPAIAGPRSIPHQTGGGTGPGVTESWSLTPTGTDPSQPGSRPTFSYTLAPGAELTDSLTVWNYSSSQMTFHVYATDAINNADGAFDLIDPEAKAKDAGSWITLEQNFVTLPPSSKIDIGLTLKVPSGAAPGDHTAGIVAASRTPGTTDEGKHVILDRRVGSRAYLRVTGSTRPELVVEDVATSYDASLNPLDGGVAVTYTLRNAGNVRLGARQLVELSDIFGAVDETKPTAIAEILPGNAVTITTHFDGVTAALWETADVTATPFSPKGTGVEISGALEPATATGHALAIPWLLAALLALLAVAILVAGRRRASGSGPGEGIGSAGAGPVGPTGNAVPRESVGAALRAVRARWS